MYLNLFQNKEMILKTFILHLVWFMWYVFRIKKKKIPLKSRFSLTLDEGI